MPGRHLPIFGIALAASLVVHAGLYTGTRRIHVSVAGDTNLPRPAGRMSTVALLGPAAAVRDDSAELLAGMPPVPSEPAEVIPPPEDVPLPQPRPPPPPKSDVEKFPDRIGTRDDEGIGTHAADGDQPLLAPKASNDQPSLSRDPRGPGAVGDPVRSTVPPGDGAVGGPALPRPLPMDAAARPLPPPLPSMPLPPNPRVEKAKVGAFRLGPVDAKMPGRDDGTESPADKMDETIAARGPLVPARPDARTSADAVDPPADRPDALIRPDGLFPAPPPVRPAASPPPAPPPLRMPDVPPAALAERAVATPAADEPLPAPPTPANAAAGASGRPGPRAPAADPAQESESEVDAFSKIEAFVRRDGRVAPQFGREVKTVRPKMLPVSLIDAYGGARSVTLRVNIGTDGRVTAVRVHRSSGSNEVDQPCVVAMYEWWFEPLRGKSGTPVPDTVLFTLNFR